MKRRVLGVVALGAIALGGCASSKVSPAGAGGGGAAFKDRAGDAPLIGLQRGASWSVMALKPPHFSGPNFHLQLKKNVLSGRISGGTAPSGTLRVKISENGAEGFGPLGPVSMTYTADDRGIEVEGLWNGGRIHFVFSQDSLKGTIASNSFFYGRANPADAHGMQSFQNSSQLASMADSVDPLPSDVSCEYYLNEVNNDGSLSGGSTCAGMPQQTRLEVPEAARTLLTQPELVTLLVAVLSAPPTVNAENFGPRPLPPPTSTPRRRGYFMR
jgi:hypothetical protein